MRQIGTCTEDEMIWEYLRAEYTSERFSEKLKRVMEEMCLEKQIILAPDFEKKEEAAQRRALLGEYRGYGQNRDMFEHFPSHIEWSLFSFQQEDLKNIRYIDYSYWNELSKGTHLPIEAVEAVRNNIRIFDVPNDGFLLAEKYIRKGGAFPRMIFLTADYQQFVIVEGHHRMTAYALAPEYFEQIEAIVGKCKEEELKGWM